MQHGALTIDRPAGYESGNGAAAIANLYGPRGGFIGSTTIDHQDAEQAIARLMAFGAKPRFLERLFNAAEAALDSEAGIVSMGELAEALHACDSRRDYRADFPKVEAEA